MEGRGISLSVPYNGGGAEAMSEQAEDDFVAAVRDAILKVGMDMEQKKPERVIKGEDGTMAVIFKVNNKFIPVSRIESLNSDLKKKGIQVVSVFVHNDALYITFLS